MVEKLRKLIDTLLCKIRKLESCCNNLPNFSLFDISVFFSIVTPFVYIAPENFKIVSIDNTRDSIIYSITVNGNPYVLGTQILKYDTLQITTNMIGFIILHCEDA